MTAYSKALLAFGAIAQTAAFTVVVPKASITQRSFFLPSYPRSSITPAPASSLFAVGDDENPISNTPEQKRFVKATLELSKAKQKVDGLKKDFDDAKKEQSDAQKEYDEALKDVPITRTNIEAGKPNAGKQNCLIVIRHGKDVADSKRINGVRTKTLPNGEKVVYYQDALTEEGKKQAKSIAKVLPKFVDNLDISAITRVITKDPKTTPNPFDTILPFIEAQNILDVRLPSTLDGIKNSQLFPDDTSVLVCFDQEVLWSPKVNGKRSPEPSSKSLLHYVNKAYEIDPDIPGPPEKGRTMYIYRGKGEMEVYKLDHLHDVVQQMF